MFIGWNFFLVPYCLFNPFMYLEGTFLRSIKYIRETGVLLLRIAGWGIYTEKKFLTSWLIPTLLLSVECHLFGCLWWRRSTSSGHNYHYSVYLWWTGLYHTTLVVEWRHRKKGFWVFGSDYSLLLWLGLTPRKTFYGLVMRSVDVSSSFCFSLFDSVGSPRFPLHC